MAQQQATGLIPEGASPLRDSARFSLDFAAVAPPRRRRDLATVGAAVPRCQRSGPVGQELPEPGLTTSTVISRTGFEHAWVVYLMYAGVVWFGG